MPDSFVNAPKVGCNPLRANRVHYVKWTTPAGDVGAAWVGSKEQLKKIRAILEAKECPEIEVQLHIIPRDKDALLTWLRDNDILLMQPLRTERTTR